MILCEKLGEVMTEEKKSLINDKMVSGIIKSRFKKSNIFNLILLVFWSGLFIPFFVAQIIYGTIISVIVSFFLGAVPIYMLLKKTIYETSVIKSDIYISKIVVSTLYKKENVVVDPDASCDVHLYFINGSVLDSTDCFASRLHLNYDFYLIYLNDETEPCFAFQCDAFSVEEKWHDKLEFVVGSKKEGSRSTLDSDEKNIALRWPKE